MELSKRLSALVNYVIKGSSVVDIGTDHGYVPVYLVKNKIVDKAIGVDVNKGPLQSGARAVRETGLEDHIDLRLGDGLAAIKPGEVDTVIIAGMGGSTMIDIFESGKEVLNKVQRLILQPMIGVPNLRDWLLEHGWMIIDEDLVVEDGRIYEIVVSQPCDKKKSYTRGQIEIGPILLEKNHPLLPRHIERIIKGYEEIIKEVAKGKSLDSIQKKKELEKKLIEIKKVLPWE